VISALKYKVSDYHALLHTKYVAPVVFVHINKTGGSSIERALGLPFQHRTALEILRAIGPRRWNSRFSFAFVRNPWDKVASHYHYRVKTNQTGLGDNPMSFPEWVRRAYAEHAQPYYDQPKMFMPQVDWLRGEDGRILVDYVGRFEYLQDDFAHVCAQLGRSAHLPHVKSSQQGDYRKYYDDESADIVARHFAEDIHAFDYAFTERGM
jgi:chondroitin 4-sulfotransferase 11